MTAVAEMTGARLLDAGDCALIMEYGNVISPALNRRVRAMHLMMETHRPVGVLETVPTYRSLMIHYDPLVVSRNSLISQLRALEQQVGEIVLPAPVVTHIPVVYGGTHGPDLKTVATHSGYTEEEVIRIHSNPDYVIYMLGFTPGFPYLGGMDQRIAAPRLKTPRERIRGGSVGIADRQTGIYSIDSPGGWQIIGWTPVQLFQPEAVVPFLLKAGEYLRFVPVSMDDCEAVQAQIAAGTYRCRATQLEEGDGKEADHERD